MRTIIAIPARHKASRLPGNPLADIYTASRWYSIATPAEHFADIIKFTGT
ncbi:MAG: hypothetical protein MUO63_08980 [Desulfobulbaceae bacterium]|nr:hypothetical protein [Desulfobulbaceae bacterium]